MDPRIRNYSGSINGIQLENPSVPVFPDQILLNGPIFDNFFPDKKQIGHGTKFGANTYLDHNFGDIHFLPNDPIPTVPSSSTSAEEEFHDEDCDFSDEILRYINQMLMEEDMEEKTCMLQESLDLQAAEKSFYDAIGKKYPPSPEQENPVFVEQYTDCNLPQNHDCCTSAGYISSGHLINPAHYSSAQVQEFPSYSASSISSLRSLNNIVSGSLDSPISPLQIRELREESQSIWQFKKGVEEASKFLPSGNGLFVNGYFDQVKNSENDVNAEKKLDDVGYLVKGLKGRKNSHREDSDFKEEERSSKQAATYQDSTVRSEEFDLVLLSTMGKGQIALSSLSDTLRNGMNKNKNNAQNTEIPKGSNQGRGRGRGRAKKQKIKKKEVIDLRTLLINCAQAVAADDRRNANELLKQIRLHSSSFGDGNQRLAHCFAEGLEARLAGTGSHIHKALVSKRTSAADFIKAYQLYLASCPFRKITHFASNRSIMDHSVHASRLHIIDFGILYGFQWPTLIQRIVQREGGPPKLRITGIEFPQPGFRPAERIEETGRRLADYAREYNVPFEYTAIAKKWETVKVEELKIEKDEFLVVNCIYRSKNLLDESVMVDSPRSIFLKLIRQIKPDLFVHGIVNGSYSAPFFVTRFRESLFHFSALFDMLETVVPREYQERMLIEREIFGREAMNVIACEGWERIEKPETYKQWHVRNLKAGFGQVAFAREFLRKAKEKVKLHYHKDFVIDEDGHWLLQGWKGRIIYAVSLWKPV